MRKIKNADLEKGMIVSDIDGGTTSPHPTFLEFVHMEGDRPQFRYVSGPKRYRVSDPKRGLIGFSGNCEDWYIED